MLFIYIWFLHKSSGKKIKFLWLWLVNMQNKLCRTRMLSNVLISQSYFSLSIDYKFLTKILAGNSIKIIFIIFFIMNRCISFRVKWYLRRARLLKGYLPLSHFKRLTAFFEKSQPFTTNSSSKPIAHWCKRYGCIHQSP